MYSSLRIAALGAVTMFSPWTPAMAAGTKFHIRQIVVNGSTNVDAEAINNKGAFVGVIGVTEGFLQDGATLTLLAGACGNGTCRTYPTNINDAGTVTGQVFGGESGGFVWQNGGFVQGDFFTIGGIGSKASGPWINRRGEITFNTITETSQQAYAGPPTAPQLQSGTGLTTNLTLVLSINRNGTLAGLSVSPQTNQGVVFVGKNGNFTDLSPQNEPANAAYVNDLGQVGGSGFVYSNGSYTTFNMPVPALDVTAQSINNKGRVIGTFVDQNANVQRVFFYNGATVSMFGAYDQNIPVHLAMNDKGTILVSVLNANGSGSASYLVRCKGDGC